MSARKAPSFLESFLFLESRDVLEDESSDEITLIVDEGEAMGRKRDAGRVCLRN